MEFNLAKIIYNWCIAGEAWTEYAIEYVHTLDRIPTNSYICGQYLQLIETLGYWDHTDPCRLEGKSRLEGKTDGEVYTFSLPKEAFYATSRSIIVTYGVEKIDENTPRYKVLYFAPLGYRAMKPIFRFLFQLREKITEMNSGVVEVYSRVGNSLQPVQLPEITKSSFTAEELDLYWPNENSVYKNWFANMTLRTKNPRFTLELAEEIICKQWKSHYEYMQENIDKYLRKLSKEQNKIKKLVNFLNG